MSLDKKTKLIRYFAVVGKGTNKQKFEMPPAYSEMYNENYLAITKRSLGMPELYDNDNEGRKMDANHYIPLYTGPNGVSDTND